MNGDTKKVAGDSFLERVQSKRDNVDLIFSKDESVTGRVVEFDRDCILLESVVNYDEIHKSKLKQEIISRRAIKKISVSLGYADLVLQLINDSLKQSPASKIIVSDVHAAFSYCFRRLDRDDYFQSLLVQDDLNLLRNAAGYLSDFQALLAGEEFDLREDGGFFYLHGYTVNQEVTASMLGDILEQRTDSRSSVHAAQAAFYNYSNLRRFNNPNAFRALLESHGYQLIHIRGAIKDSYTIEDHAVRSGLNQQSVKKLESV